MMTEKQLVVLRDFARGDMTADELVTKEGRRWYVNTWSPIVCNLRKAGYLARTGEQRTTLHGSSAHVLTLTDKGAEALAEADQ
jgi:hypothetical protein